MSQDGNRTVDSLSAQVNALYNKFGIWREVGAEIGWEAVDRGIIDSVNGHAEGYGVLANAVSRGAVNDSPKLRAALGLPPKTVRVPPCPECGEVHERLNTCTERLEKQRSKKTYLVTFRFHDEANAIALRRLFDAHGANRREIAEKLLDGRLSITEVIDEHTEDTEQRL